MALLKLAPGRIPGRFLAAAVIGYVEVATGCITGLTGGDPVYLGGYLFILTLAPVVPIPRNWLWGLLAVSLGCFWLTGGLVEFGTGLGTNDVRARYSLTDLLSCGVVVGVLVYVLDRIRFRAFEMSREIERQRVQLAADHDRIDALLLNILPPPIADELKARDRVEPRYYNSATVVFTDFAGFTQVAEHITPQRLLAELDLCFRGFDQVMDRHNLEKLKTIGDAYMFAGGVPAENLTHAVDATLASLEIQDFLAAEHQARQDRGEAFWRVRIGINTGPLIAGVVGQKKFVYDVWGDTVNLAARMESSGEVGCVNVSAATAALIEPFFVIEPRGRLPAKNKGMVEMFFVRGIRAELSLGGAGRAPNPAFRARYEALRRV